MALGRIGVVAGHDRGVEDLLEGVPSGLPRLELDDVEQLVLAGEDEIVEAQQDLPPGGEARLAPLLLGGARTGDGERDIGRCTAGCRGQGGAGGRADHVHGLPIAAAGSDAGGQGAQMGGVDAG